MILLLTAQNVQSHSPTVQPANPPTICSQTTLVLSGVGLASLESKESAKNVIHEHTVSSVILMPLLVLSVLTTISFIQMPLVPQPVQMDSTKQKDSACHATSLLTAAHV